MVVVVWLGHMASPADVEPEFKLVDESQEGSFDCPVCLQLLSDPCTTKCCKKDFCRSCIVKIRNSGGQCPLCRNSEFKTKRNTDLSCEVCHLQVYCANQSKGCEWIGDLGEAKVHLNLAPIARYQSNGCQFVVIQCAYCSANFTRREILEHQSQCPKRPFSCEYCQNYDSFYEDVCNHHWTVCGSYPIVCPNGCSRVIQRHSVEEHIDNDCPLTITECEFKPYGCKERLPRVEMQTHMKCSVAAHESLKMMTRVVKMLKAQEKNVREIDGEVLEKHQKLEKEQTALKRKISSISNEVNVLCKAVEKQDERLKTLEARLASKTYGIKEEIWEKLNHRLTAHDNAIRHQTQHQMQHQMQHLKEAMDVLYFVFMNVQSRCPFVHNHGNPVTKLTYQILTLECKYVIGMCICLAIGFLVIVYIYFWFTIYQ